MLKIKLDDYDQLNNLVEEISIITCLLDLSQSYCKYIIYDNKLDDIKKHIDSYLIHKQRKTVSLLLELLDKKDFAVSDKKFFADKSQKLL